MADENTTNSEVEIVITHNQMMLLGVILGVDSPEGSFYTPEYGAQVKTALDVLRDKLKDTVNVVIPMSVEASVDRDIVDAVVAYVAQGMTPAQATALGVTSRDDVVGMIDGFDRHIRQLDAVDQAPVTFEEIFESVAAQSGVNVNQTNTNQTSIPEIPQDIKERVLRIEAQLAKVASSLGNDANIPSTGAVDGVFDAQSYASYEAVLQYMAKQAEVSVPAGGYTAEFGQELQEALISKINAPLHIYDSSVDTNAVQRMGSMAILRNLMDLDSDEEVTAKIEQLRALKADLPGLVADLNYLKSHDALKVVTPTVTTQNNVTPSGGNTNGTNDNSGANAGSPNTGSPNTDNVEPEKTPEEIKADAINSVEATLFLIGGQLNGSLPGIGGMVAKFLPEGSLFTPLSVADIEDGVFSDSSQDMASKIIMGLKMLDAQGEANAPSDFNGVFNEAISRKLKIAILSEGQFSVIRDAEGFGLPNLGEGRTASAAQAAAVQLIDYDKNYAAFMKRYNEEDAAGDVSEATARTKAQFDAFGRDNKEALKAVEKLNGFMDNLVVLQQAGIYSNDEAKKATTMNMMMDAASTMMDKYAPGLKSFLQDFFTNNELGQMIAGILPMFGINVGRLWGDKDDAAGMDRAKPAIESRFTKFYEDAKADLGVTADHAQIMAQTKTNIMEQLDDSRSFKIAMNIMFKDQDEDVIRAAVDKALDAAIGKEGFESSRAAFTQSLIDSGKQFQNGRTIDFDEVARHLNEASNDISATANANPQFTPVTGVSGAGVVTGTTTSSIDSDDLSGNNDGSQSPGDALPIGSDRDKTQPAVDAEIVKAGDQRVELVYNANREDMLQGPRRFSDGRVDDLQEVLANNGAALELSLGAGMMHNRDGDYTDTLTSNTNAVIEEIVIRAQLHKLSENDVEITQAVLDNMDTKLSMDTLDIVTAYMTEKGVSEGDINRFAANVTSMGEDYYSTVAGDRSAGDRQQYTVLEQSVFNGQFDMSVAQWAPRVELNIAPVEDDTPMTDLQRRYLEGNKDRDCEGPLFYTKPGDDAVYALIRDKNGNDDPTDDEFKELSFDDYQEAFRIQRTDGPELKALLDNYNWEHPTEMGVRNMINKVLCLEPPHYTVYMAPEPVPEVEPTRVVRSTQTEPHPTPETFDDLRRVTPEQRERLIAGIGIDKMSGIMSAAEVDIREPLNLFFENAMGNRQVVMSQMYILDLSDFDMRDPEMNALVAIRNGDGSVDIRYVDYETDYIKPIEEQRAGGYRDMTESYNPAGGPRRLDDFLDEISRSPGGHIRGGSSGGYLNAISIVPFGGGARNMNSFDVVYGAENRARYNVDYIEAYGNRYSERSAYESNRRVREAVRSGGHSLPGATPPNEHSPSRQEFNNRSGCEPENLDLRGRNRFESRFMKMGRNFRQLGKLFSGDCRQQEDHDDSDRDIRQNIGDMGVQGDVMSGVVYGEVAPSLRVGQ